MVSGRLLAQERKVCRRFRGKLQPADCRYKLAASAGTPTGLSVFFTRLERGQILHSVLLKSIYCTDITNTNTANKLKNRVPALVCVGLFDTAHNLATLTIGDVNTVGNIEPSTPASEAAS